MKKNQSIDIPAPGIQSRAKSGMAFGTWVLLSYLLLGTPRTAADEPVPVTVKSVAELAVFPSLSAPAVVISLNNSRLSAEIIATIIDIPVNVGQMVEPGTPLVQLDSTDLELGIERAEAILRSIQARYQSAQNELQRAEKLRQRGMSEEEIDRRKTQLEISEAELNSQRATVKQLQRNLEKAIVRAPFKAIVMERLSSVGELAAPGTPLIRVVDAEHVLVSAKLQPQHTASLIEADNVQYVNSTGRYPVTFVSIVPALDLRERHQEARLRFTSEAAMIGSADQIVWSHQQIHLPADVIVRRKDALGVFVTEHDQARLVVLPDAQEGRPAKTALSKDSLVIIDGRYVLEDGDPVRIVESPIIRD